MSGLSQHSVPISLNFNNVSLSIDDREILHDVGGKVKPGQLLAIMGPSGSGKTTLLNILAGRLNADSGDVLINGKHITKKLKKKIGFVLQEDIFFAHLTLKETLIYSALLRLPDTLSKQEKLQKVEEIVEILDIRKCLNTCIGSPLTRGLSGGEKKRANIGCELITNPSILFLDEPTSGLDSSNALNLIKTLKTFAGLEKKTIVFSIHQPSSQIFHMFDKLLLLCNGKIAFYGKATRALDFFSSIGLHCEPHFNPADYILEKVTAEKDIQDFIVDSWTRSASRHQQLKTPKTKDHSNASVDKLMTNNTLSSNPGSDNSLQKSCSSDEKVLSQENLSYEGNSDNESEELESVFYSVPTSRAEEHAQDSNHILLSPVNNTSRPDSPASTCLDATSDSEQPMISLVNNTSRPDSPTSTCVDATSDSELPMINNTSRPDSPISTCLNARSYSELPMISFKKVADDTHLDIHDDDDDDHQHLDVNTEWVTSFWTQFSVMTQRTFKQSKPEILSKLNIVQTIILAVLVGLIWFRIPHTEESIRDRYAMIFFVMTYWNFNPLFSALLSFPTERTVINKERAAGYYRLSAYYFGKLVSELPLVICQPVVFIIISYWMSGLNRSVVFLQFIFTTLLMCFTAQSVGLFISATVTDFKQCITVASVFGLACMLLGGFYQQHIPPWLAWFEYISFLSYTYNALMIVEFSTSKPFRCQGLSIYDSCKNNASYIEGHEVLSQLGVTTTYWENIGYLFVFAVIARMLTYLSLRFLHKPK